MQEAWYRIEDRRVSVVIDAEREEYGVKTEVYVRRLFVRKRTPQGVWLAEGEIVRARFVLLGARKRWACPTLDEAMASYHARKTRQVAIYQARAEHARYALRKAEQQLARWKSIYNPETPTT